MHKNICKILTVLIIKLGDSYLALYPFRINKLNGFEMSIMNDDRSKQWYNYSTESCKGNLPFVIEKFVSTLFEANRNIIC